jgi:hypothetical protein
VVINEFDIFCARINPTKAEAPLIIDPNTVLAISFSLQRFEAIARRHAQVIQSRSDLKLPELSPCNLFNAREAPNSIASGECLRVNTAERSDHVK